MSKRHAFKKLNETTQIRKATAKIHQSMAAKLLRVAKERFLEKQIQHSETFAQNAYLSETSKTIIAPTEGTDGGGGGGGQIDLWSS